MTYEFVALEIAKFLATAKSFIHEKSYTLSVYWDAIAFVLSVEPVSTTMISGIYGVRHFKQCSILFCSFFTIMQTDMFIYISFISYS